MDEPAYADLRYRSAAGVAHIELHRPQALNAWTPAMGRELLDAVRQVSSDDAVRAVLITGAGTAFYAGADVKNARELTADGSPDLAGRLREIYNPIVLGIRCAAVPFVAAVQGPCAGLGVSLALACDLVLAAEDAYLLLAFVRWGVLPDGGATAFLAERVGLARAAQLCKLGERLPARRALEWGQINAVHPPADLLPAAQGLAERLAAGPTVALGNIKRALGAAAQGHLAAQLELDATLQAEHGRTWDYAEGRAAFLDKRRPDIRGR